MTVALHHREVGPTNGRPVLLGAALGGTHRMWDELVADLGVDHRVIAFDARGHGASPSAVAGVSIADLAGDVLALADRLGIAEFDYVGLSMSGAVGQRLALDSDRLRSLTLACTAAYFGGPGPWQQRAETVRREGMGPIRETNAERWFSPTVAAERVLQVLDDLVTCDPQSYANVCEAVGGFDSRGRLGDISAPTLVITGGLDRGAPREVTRELVDGIRECTDVVLPRSAHLANLCQPDAFAEAVRGLLART